MFNLSGSELPNSNLFHHLPRFEEISYQGLILDYVMKFKAVREGQECVLLAVTTIRKDEDFLWHSTKDFLDRAVKQAAGMTRGIYTFDLLTFDFHKENASFTHGELAQVLANTSLGLKPGGQALIRYSSVYGLLQKMVDEPWGKIVLKTAVQVFADKPNFLYVLAGKMLKSVEFAHGPAMVLINDISSQPLYDPANPQQKVFLDKLIAAQKAVSMEFVPEVFVQDKNGLRDVLSGIKIC